MSIRTTRFSTGERFALLADEPFGIPDSWVAGYAVTSLRTRRLRLSTVENLMEGIQRGLAFCRSMGIEDLRSRVLTQFFDDDQLSRLAAHCGERVAGGEPLVKGGSHYTAFIDYVLWLAAQPTENVIDKTLHLLMREDFKARARQAAPADVDGNAQGIRLGLTEAQRDLFLRVIVPTAPDNPFGMMAFRNFVLFSMSFCLGLRASELRGIKVSHLDLKGQTAFVSIVRNLVDDPEDKRSDPAMQKTLARDLVLSSRLALACEKLIDEREEFRAAKRHPFLFVNNRGDAIGSRGLRKVYQTLRQRHSELGDLINHQLRHDWNDRWNELVREKGWDIGQCQEVQLRTMGWGPGSKMQHLYGYRSRQKLANEWLAEMQEVDLTGLNAA